ncbi:MAG: hypothetical protein M1834_006986 [Cirrosporium novae-zelandiae]|nr:MAG: hypothetical protein M1834_006986 [Cirrosporium novae-zelandiae]
MTTTLPTELEKLSVSDLLLSDRGLATQALHADEAIKDVPDVAPPIHVSTTFRYPENPEELVPLRAPDETLTSPPTSKNSGLTTPHVYSRHTAPNTTRLETLLSTLLHGRVLTYTSGLAALHAALVFLNPKRIAIGHGYHGCQGVVELHQKLTNCSILDLDCPADSLGEGDVIHLETPINPTGEAFDIKHYADKAHSRGAYLIVDSTFAPPPLQDPFALGADIVMHAGTKYIGGHSDMLCGILAVKSVEWQKQLLLERLVLGSVMGSLEGWLGVRSLRTLELRVKRQSTNATNLVQWLHGQLTSPTPNVTNTVLAKIAHASLQTSEMAWLEKQMPNGYGPVFSIWMKNEELARHLPSRLGLFMHATSLGGVESLIEWRTMTDSTQDVRLLRISVGVEDWEDLRDDFEGAFRGLSKLA